MRLILIALIVALAPLGISRPHATKRAAKSAPLGVSAAIAFCQAHPAAEKRLSIRGWFVATVAASGYIDGGLFPSKHAVPPGPTNDWDLDGKWVQAGAVLAHITTHASFGDLTLTLHGVLDCSTFQFTSDRDPFPPPHLRPSYGAISNGNSGPVTEWAQAGGLRLSLTVPRRTYPLNALARVTVSIRNVSHHSVGYLAPGISPPGVMAPQAEVLSSGGQVLFPPVMESMPPIPGPPPSTQTLASGKAVTAREDIVVRGPLIRATQPFTPRWPKRVHRALNTLTTHTVRVRLTAEPAPVLSFQQTAQGPAIDVIPPPGMHGEPLLISYADCGVTDSGPRYTYISIWTPTELHITPGCAPLQAWHVRLGWRNHPVAQLDYP